MLEQHIRERAFAMWEAAGRPNGRDLEYWLAAESDISEVAAVSPVSAPAPKKTTRKRKTASVAPKKAASTAPKKTTAKAKATRKPATRTRTTKKEA